jgi:isopentenyl-diphosphate delta-isomerase
LPTPNARGSLVAAVVPPTTTRTMATTTTTSETTQTTAWTAQGARTQDEFMLRDRCIVVDERDNIAGAASKLDCHRFGPGPSGPSGRLHRAFSVFLFDASGRLLLQQRAASKITFPGVWTNTCCSHQLHGQPSPGEVDDKTQVEQKGEAPGAVAAARRKLEHELGISPDDLPASCFTFVTRLHYCAPDSETHGPNPEWGEHEVDYILLARMKKEEEGASGGAGAGATTAAATPEEDRKQHAWEVPPQRQPSDNPVSIPADPAMRRPALRPDPDEVGGVRWVTPGELEAMMGSESGLRWSPWFRIIAREWLLPRWWKDLEGAFAGKHGDYAKVHRIDC